MKAKYPVVTKDDLTLVGGHTKQIHRSRVLEMYTCNLDHLISPCHPKKFKFPKQCACIVIHWFDHLRAGLFKVVCWEAGGRCHAFGFLLFFGLSTGNEGVILPIQVVVVVVQTDSSSFASLTLPSQHQLSHLLPQQFLSSSFFFCPDRNWDHRCARLGAWQAREIAGV